MAFLGWLCPNDAECVSLSQRPFSLLFAGDGSIEPRLYQVSLTDFRMQILPSGALEEHERLECFFNPRWAYDNLD